MRSGFSARKKWARPTSGSASSSSESPWSTPVAGNFGTQTEEAWSQRAEALEAKGFSRPSVPLGLEARIWGEKAKKLWATPEAHLLDRNRTPEQREEYGSRPGWKKAGQRNLSEDAQEWGESLSGLLDGTSGTPGPESSAPGRTSPPPWRLNPRFTEWLMGWIIGWTSLDASVTEWIPWWQLTRSALYGLICGPGSPAGSSSWQTTGTDSFRSRGGDRKDEMGLDRQAKDFASRAWPPALAGDARSSARGTTTAEAMHDGETLTDAIREWADEAAPRRLWPTATALSGVDRTRGTEAQGGELLTEAVREWAEIHLAARPEPEEDTQMAFEL